MLDAPNTATTILAMFRANPAQADELLSNRVTDAIARYRKLLFFLLGLLYVFSFNGRWRLGSDTAIFRGLALNLVAGKGYVFGSGVENKVYPGLPYVLAGIERVLGPSNRAPSLAEQQRLIGPSAATSVSVLFVFACAILTLIVVYHLIRLHYPIWVATTITCGVGTNAIFLQHAHELLSDMPFTLGVVTSLYAWELLQRATDRKATIRALALLIPAVGLAAVMRPTFWILALCWVVACFGAFILTRRRLYLICLVSILIVWAGFIAAVSHFRGFHPLTAGYDREITELVPATWTHMSHQVAIILHAQLPAAMFGEQLAPFSILGSLVLIGSTLLLARRHAMWVLLVFVTLLVTIRLSAQPRYYMMILPTLMLGWLVLFCRLARRVPQFWGELILIGGLSIVTLNNLSASVHLFREQRLGNFLKQYRNGEYIPAVELSEVVRQHLKPSQKVLAPWGSVMSVLSGRHVYTQREIFPRNGGIDSPKVLLAIGLDYVFTPGSAYRRKEPLIERLMAKRVIRPIKVVAVGPGEFSLMTLIINVPVGDWRQIQRPPRAATAPASPKRPPKRARPPKSVIRAQAQAATTQRSP